MEDRITVGLEFKFSKNYNSIGGSIGISSDKGSNESIDDAFVRVYKKANECLDKISNDGETTLRIKAK